MLLVIGAAASVVFLMASYFDIRHRSIPNWLPLAVAGAALVKWLVIGHLSSALWAIGVAAIVLLIAAAFFTQGLVGGGDVKLMAAAVLLLGAPAAPEFLLLMALIGGAIAAVVLIAWYRARPRPTIPYGVAIASAAIAVMALDWRGVMAA